MLIDIQKQLAINEVMTEKQLANYVKISPDALSPMLTLLIKRGLVEKLTSGHCAGGCGCVSTSVTAYRWLGKNNNITPLNILSV